MNTTLFHVLNLGAGVQSTKLALDFEAGRIMDDAGAPVRLTAAVFADTQDEPADVYRHLEWLMKSVRTYPIQVCTKGRLSDDLKNGVNSTGQRFASIPAFTKGSGARGQMQRQCSKEYKIEVIDRHIRRNILGLQAGRPVPVGKAVIQYLGISLDECGRAVRVMRNRAPKKYREQANRQDYGRLLAFFDTRRWRFRFPLVDQFITRAGCLKDLANRVPHQTPRSACVFCPYHDDFEWSRLKESPDADDWRRAVEVDHSLRAPGNIVNRNMEQPMYLHGSCQPLDLVQFNTTPDPRRAQLALNFSADCLGMCGL
jgi:hypothetical protein